MPDVARDWRQFALLIIDVQKDFWSEQTAQRFPDFPANITRLLTLCRAEGIEVVHIRASFKLDMSDWMATVQTTGTYSLCSGDGRRGGVAFCA